MRKYEQNICEKFLNDILIDHPPQKKKYIFVNNKLVKNSNKNLSLYPNNIISDSNNYKYINF